MNNAITSSAKFWVDYWKLHHEAVIGSLARILVIVLGYVIIRLVTFRVADRVMNSLLVRASGEFIHVRKARVNALRTMLRSVVGFILGFVTCVMILEAAGINIAALITVASVVGLAIGFGSQKLVKDVISGFFILSEDQYGVGDYVTIGAVSGLVEDLGMRTTRIRERSGKLFIVSNGDIVQVTNHSRGKFVASFDFPVIPSADISKAVDLLGEVGKKIAEDIPDKVKEPLVCSGVSAVSGTAITLRLSGHVVARYQEDVQLELNSRVRTAFAGSEIAFG